MKKSFVSVLALLLVLLTACGQQTSSVELPAGETDTQTSEQQQETPEIPEAPETLPAPAPEVQPEPEAQPQPDEVLPQNETETVPEVNPKPQPEASASDVDPNVPEITDDPPEDDYSNGNYEEQLKQEIESHPNYEGEKEGMGFDPNEGEYFEVPQPSTDDNGGSRVRAEHGITEEEFNANPEEYRYLDFSKYNPMRDEIDDRNILNYLCMHPEEFEKEPRYFDEYSYLFLQYPEYLDPEKYPRLFEVCPRFYELIG